jgi:hypothetical protein
MTERCSARAAVYLLDIESGARDGSSLQKTDTRALLSHANRNCVTARLT